MGEEKKEEEEKKEQSKEENKAEEKKDEPQEIVLKVYMHCEGCARKVQRSLRGFEGVEDVKADSKSHKVVVTGKTADPIKVCERIQRKSGRKVEIISPLPKPPEEEKKVEEKAKEEKKEEPAVITVVLKVLMHCEACAQALQRRIRKMDGIESVTADPANDHLIVKGVFDPIKLVEKVYRRTRKQASIVKDEKEEEKKEVKEEEKGEEEKKEGDEGKGEEEDKKIDVKKNEHWPTKYYMGYAETAQIFSDENPNACSLM